MLFLLSCRRRSSSSSNDEGLCALRRLLQLVVLRIRLLVRLISSGQLVRRLLSSFLCVGGSLLCVRLLLRRCGIQHAHAVSVVLVLHGCCWAKSAWMARSVSRLVEGGPLKGEGASKQEAAPQADTIGTACYDPEAAYSYNIVKQHRGHCEATPTVTGLQASLLAP